MAEYSSNAVQTVNPGESVTFTTAPFPCNRGFIRWRQWTGAFNLAGWVPGNMSSCCCNQARAAQYMVDFGANIGIPEGGTAGPISVAYALDGVTLPETTMTVQGVVDGFTNVSRATIVPVWKGCCQTLTVRNISEVPIQVQNANIVFSRPDLAMTY